ncbi:MAG: crossover junction endodeoxyribonuclease RuvC [Candidatus Parcubacteria bacterium]|nr:crossover junction endodeoxyribonuclease RuvC [Candidatus Parcubacteria bacterium]
MIILGIDPGFDRMGCAVIKKENNKENLLYSTCLITDRKLTYEKRLLSLGKEIKKIIKKFRPNVIAVEKVFFFKNQKTVMRIAEVRGIILYLSAASNIPVKEFTPLQIKMGMTGYGRAEKQQVQKMVSATLKIKKTPKYDDEMDAIAIALICPCV